MLVFTWIVHGWHVTSPAICLQHHEEPALEECMCIII